MNAILSGMYIPHDLNSDTQVQVVQLANLYMHDILNRLKGSSLQVMGPVVEEGEWAIVGGTGEFCLAQGIIYKKFLEQQSNGNIIELDIHAFYSAVRPWTLGAV